MAILQSGASSTTQTVDPANNAARVTLYDANSNVVKLDTDGSQKVQIRAPAFGALGCYSKALTSGNIASPSAVNAVMFLMRWTDGTRFCLVERIRVAVAVVATITTAVPYNIALLFCRGFTVSPTTNIGTTGTFTGSNAKRRTSHGTSLFTTAGAGMWVLGTAAAGLTGQTLGADTDPISSIGGGSGTVAGTGFFGSNPINLWDDNVDAHPLIIGNGEGLAVTAPLAGPASGTYQIIVAVDWMEVAAY